MADQQLIEIAKSLSVEARVLILDEPTASLSAHEVERLFTIVRRLRDRGVAVLFVSHRLDEVFELCDRATVFRDGRHVVTTPTERADDRRPRPAHGRPDACRCSRRSRRRSATSSSRSTGLTRAGVFRDVTFAVRAGEIVGLAGLVGAGRTEVARVLFGIDQRDAGEIRLGGTPVSFASPSAAMDAGIAYLPEDRHQEGLVLDFSIAQNVTLPILPRLFPRLLVRARDGARGRARLHRAVQRPDDRRRPARRRAVRRQPAEGRPRQVAGVRSRRVLILDEPTRGIDIGAKVEVHRIISELAASGLGDHPHLERPARGPRDVRPDPRPPRGPDHGRDRRATDATEERVMFAATGNVDGRRGRRRRRRRMAEPARPRSRAAPREPRRAWLARRRPPARAQPRRRSCSCSGALVAIAAPQFLTVDNLTQVAVLASIIAVAAVGEALVVITRNVDLSVEAMIGPGRLLRRRLLEQPHARRAGAIAVRDRPRPRPRDGQRRSSSTVLRVPAIVATLGHAEHLPRASTT